MRSLTIRIAVLSLALAVIAMAADARTVSGTAKGMLHKANDLIGMSVQDSTGRDIGSIEDLVLDNSLETVTHAVFSHRTARDGWQHFAIPFDSLTMNSAGDAIMLDVADIRDLEEADLRVSRAWFQGPVDVEWAPVEERQYARDSYTAEEPLIDIYGRPIPGRARTPYVQNVYERGADRIQRDMDFDDANWRAYERDQYGRPVYERDYYVGDESFGHNGYSVQEKVGWGEAPVYGRPIYRGFDPSRSDWRWGDSSLESDYDVYGRPITRDRYGKQLEYDRYGRPMSDYDRYGRPLDYDRFGSVDYDRYGRPIYRDYDRTERPLSRDTWRDREFDRTTYGKTGRDMGAWFKTDWRRDGSRLGVRRVSNLIGTDVAVRGRDAGNIEDLVIDMREGHVAYMLISLIDTFAGSPNRMAAIPWNAVDLLPDQRLADVDISRSQLLRLAFTADSLPNLEDMTYARRLHQEFDISPYWEVLGYVEPSGVSKYSGTAWNADSWYAEAFDPDNVMTFSGTIQSVSTFKPAPDATAGLRLRVRTDDGRLMLVNAGPSGFATQKGISFNVGDRIMITGSRAQMAGQNVFLASQLEKDNQTVQLRTRQGRPLW